MSNGINYFPLMCNLDEKFELIEAEFGLKGFAVVVKLLQRIYGEHGYYCEWNDEVELLFAKRLGLAGRDSVSEIVRSAIKRGIFSKEKFDDYGILTSTGIQKRFFEIAKRKKIEVIIEYLLIPYDNFSENAYISLKNVNSFSENADIFGQRKEKESKVKKSKENKSTGAQDAPRSGKSIPPTVEEVRVYCQERNNGIDAEAFIDFYEARGWMVGKTKMKDWQAAVRTWERRNKEGAAASGKPAGNIPWRDSKGNFIFDEYIIPDSAADPEAYGLWCKRMSELKGGVFL